MCGFAGVWGLNASETVLRRRARPLAQRLRHRGPDDEGFFVDGQFGFAVAHQRLAVIDPSPEGAQPMRSHCLRYVIAFNGEIYNHRDLRRSLGEAGAAPQWHGESDTETLLAAIACWGLEGALGKARGMFALALWDTHTGSLALARDRFGEKPLYFAQEKARLVFASELHAFDALEGAVFALDEEAIAQFLALSYIPAPRTIFRNVFKLEPGKIARFSYFSKPPELTRWFDLDEVLNDTARTRTEVPLDQTARLDALDTLLGDVVEQHMLADVPLGAFLSGGIDSSLVTALMQERAGGQVQSFSIGFDDARFDESAHAQAVAKSLGTEHHAIRLTARDAIELVPHMAEMFDEPFADASAIPTALLCREARKHVTVALTGDGADELFGGYNRHFRAPEMWARVRCLPTAIRAPLFRAVAGLRGLLAPSNLGEFSAQKWRQFATAFGEGTGERDLYRRLVQTGPEFGLHEHIPAPIEAEPWTTFTERMMRWDALGYLPGDILTKVDRASMAYSLETRAPFLDLRVARAAWEFPGNERTTGRSGKLPLRELLARRLPRDHFDRPKQGFAVPLADWLRGPLREWGEGRLAFVEDAELLAPYSRTIAACWKAHLSGRANHATLLGNAFFLADWLERRGLAV